MGLSYSDFNPVLVDTSLAISKAYGTEGVLYGIPLDTHTSILYFNANVLRKAGLLGRNGRPLASAFTGMANFTRFGYNSHNCPWIGFFNYSFKSF